VAGKEVDDIRFIHVSPQLFGTLRMMLLRGRDFRPSDHANTGGSAIINQRMADQVWPGQDPLGKRFDLSDAGNLEVVGVVGNSRDQNVRDAAEATAYLPFHELGASEAWLYRTLELRYHGAPGSVETAVRQIVKAVAPGYQVSKVASLEVMRDQQLHQERLLAFLSSLFGVLGTALAMVGIYGLIAYAVRRRTREIGIRVSMGAQRRDVLWLFLREVAVLLAAGLLLGIPAAFLLARFVTKLLYDVPARDPAGITMTVALFALAGLLASIVPAVSATRVSPMEALRED